jgi:RNA polymerase sigma factor (sigma-70 family)
MTAMQKYSLLRAKLAIDKSSEDGIVSYTEKTKEVVMKKYKNWGIDMDGLSMTDPERYRKINAVLNEKGKKKDLLDIVETVPLDYAYYLSDGSPLAEDIVFDNELKNCLDDALMTLKPREERVIRRRFGIGVNDATREDIGQDFSVTRERISQIEAKALRKLMHPSVSRKMRPFLDY